MLLLLTTVTFDGFLATPLWLQIADILQALLPALGGTPWVAIKTVGLVAFAVLCLGVYYVCSWVMAVVTGRRLSGGTLARAFILTLIPIALAYHMAHYFSFLLIQGQLLIPLLSDPFGVGWNVLGSAGYRPNIGIVGARFAWFTVVIAIVVGHIMAVYLAHAVALHTWREYAPALRSQYPMLVLMVGYTMVSLWILSQPIVERDVDTSVVAASSPTGGVAVPPDALLPEAGSGILREVGEGHTAAARITYQVLTSAFHDGTRMTIADLLYPYIVAYRWSVRPLSEEGPYDPNIAQATALIRERLVGLKVVRTDRSELGLGELKLVREIPVIDVYVDHAAADASQVAALAPPWSSVPWHLLVLMEEVVQRGWAAYSSTEAQRRGVPWLDLVRDQTMKEQLVQLTEAFTRHGHVPAPLQPFVTVGEAQQRWTALHRFFQSQGHFLVSNGPYRLVQWSADGVTLQAFRDVSYPLGVGSYDRTTIPRRAYISQVAPRAQGLEIHVEIDRVNKFQRTYEIVREPLQRAATSGREEALPLCRYIVVQADGAVAHTGMARYTGDSMFVVELQGKLKPGLYTILVALYVYENYVNPEIKMLPYQVDARP